jgi:hypothetical protein
MKTYQKIFFTIILAGLFLVGSFIGKLNAQISTGGIYQTYDDYLHKHVTPYDEITLGAHSFKGVLKGQKFTTSYKDVNFWGIQSEESVDFRVNKKANIIDRIITKGKVCLYAGRELDIKLFDDGKIKSMDIKGDDGKWSDIFWVSDGIEGVMIPASIDNLTKLFADSPDLVAKMTKVGIDEKDAKKWLDNFTNVNAWIAEYDKAHK